MAGEHRMLSDQLVMVTGPIAAGKSTLARELIHLLRAGGSTVALNDPDTVAEMALPTLPDWGWAHRIHAQLVRAWLVSGVDVVVDEDTSTVEEVRQVLGEVLPGVRTFHVVLTADYRRSLARARSDPGRGLSRNPGFLRADHDSFAQHLPNLPCDVLLDVEGHLPQDLARQVLY